MLIKLRYKVINNLNENNSLKSNRRNSKSLIINGNFYLSNENDLFNPKKNKNKNKSELNIYLLENKEYIKVINFPLLK